jgi:hypothetical protein
MTTRQRALDWIKQHHPSQAANPLRTSKYFPDREIWFFTFSSDFFESESQQSLNILCEEPSNNGKFRYLKVPFSFFREHREKFDIRSTGDKFDLHISAKKKNWLTDERSRGVTFAQFVQ